MRTVILGGSFDPIHIGHLFLAEEVMTQLGYQRVVFIPVAEAPHKSASGESSPEQRLEMLKIATQPYERFVVDDCEIRRGGRSFTVETVPLIRERYRPSGRLGMVIGDDLLEGFEAWKDYEKLLDMIDLVVAHRRFEQRVEFAFPHEYVDNLLLPLSSSEIRRRVAEGKAYRHIVPEPVFGYIEHHMLYRQRDDN